MEEIIYNKLIKNKRVIWDIGAHIGKFCPLFASLDAEVVAIEPSQANFSELLANTEKFPNVHCYNYALNDKTYDCTTQFRDCKQELQQPIKYITIVDFIKKYNLNYPDFIKCDIEGSEGILAKTINFERHQLTVCMEMHVAPRNNRHQDYADNPHFRYPEQGGFDFNLLKEWNYRLQTLDAHSSQVQPKDVNLNWNPLEGYFGMYIITHKEVEGY